MRTAITYLDKVLAYSNDVTVENVVKALGVADYDTMMILTTAILNGEQSKVIETVEEISNGGKDIKQFIRQYVTFVLDIRKVQITGSYEYGQLPQTEALEAWVSGLHNMTDNIIHLMNTLVKIHNTIKYDSNPKGFIEIYLLREAKGL